MKRIEVVASTMGQSSLASYGNDGYYKYNKDPGWPADRSAYENQDKDAPPPPATVAKAAARAERIAEFARHRAQGLSIPEAGRKLGIKPKTAYAYERESKAAP